MATQVSLDERLFTWPSEEPRLIGSRCLDCDNHMFPSQNECPKCAGANNETVELGTKGTLWTWTIQGYPPKSPPYKGPSDPKTFEPFGVGYVELPGQLKVETRLTVATKEELQIGMDMELVIVPLYTNDDGEEVMTFAFAPTA